MLPLAAVRAPPSAFGSSGGAGAMSAAGGAPPGFMKASSFQSKTSVSKPRACSSESA